MTAICRIRNPRRAFEKGFPGDFSHFLYFRPEHARRLALSTQGAVDQSSPAVLRIHSQRVSVKEESSVVSATVPAETVPSWPMFFAMT